MRDASSHSPSKDKAKSQPECIRTSIRALRTNLFDKLEESLGTLAALKDHLLSNSQEAECVTLNQKPTMATGNVPNESPQRSAEQAVCCPSSPTASGRQSPAHQLSFFDVRHSLRIQRDKENPTRRMALCERLRCA
ncbi:hypothetical protein NDU88_006668 [Pleurodeles waltl]|uniref:Uncharacterized protein n=1 Tax=Pleurodeles waltl TaxID=8319 RepID=A0AAV7WY83_PLEWA|nr:hypothetical protein NDU88_006668 [Pleurodeles waltl]